MDRMNLQEHVRTLAMLPETDEPVVSCYATLEDRRLREPNLVDEQIQAIRAGLTGKALQALEEALQPVLAFLTLGLSSDAKGAAVFSRAGKEPFFLTLRFRVPLPNWIVVDTTPRIYHLVELKDTYEQYVVMLATKGSIRIFEMNVGTATERLSAALPELRKDSGRKHPKERYQRQMKERERRFIKESIQVQEQILANKKHSHLILAGHPTMTARVHAELPASLLTSLAGVVRASDSDVVQATIDAFIKAEEEESQTIARKLAEQISSGDLGVAGTAACFEALKRDQADTLVLLKAYTPGQFRVCRACNSIAPEAGRILTCPECGCEKSTYLDIKEQMVRLAEQQLCAVEVVNESEFLAQVGGVGCLLRYRLAHKSGRGRASVSEFAGKQSESQNGFGGSRSRTAA